MRESVPKRDDLVDRLLTVAQAADLLGMTRSAVYTAIARREIPYLRLSKRRIRFRRGELDRWLETRRVEVL